MGGEAEANSPKAVPPAKLTIPLANPVELGQITVHELNMREPTAGEMIEMEGKTGWTFNVALVSIVSGVPEAAVRKIGVADMKKATKYLDLFFD